MATLFSKIIDGELPGRFVWKDDAVVAFLTIAPLAPGHVLVIPRAEVNRWTDASAELMQKLIAVAQLIGQAQIAAFSAARAGLIIAGFEVEHLHLHVWPSNSMVEYNFAAVDNDPDPAELDANAERLRSELRAAGHADFVPKT